MGRTQAYDPGMVYTDHRSMRNQDRYLNFALVRAPLADVTAAAGGIMRACENGAVVTEGDTTPPILHATKAGGRFSLRRGVLVSRPAGAEIVLVEFNYHHNPLRALSMMLPSAEVIGFRSNWENKNHWFHELSVHRSGALVRRVDVDKGLRKRGLSFVSEGQVQTFETPAHYEAEAMDDRLTRPILLDYARRCWLDIEGALIGRDLEGATYIEGFDALEAPDGADRTPHRTTRWQAEHDRAVALKIGKGEDPLEQIEAQNTYLEGIERLRVFSNRFAAAMQRALPDPAKTRKAYDKWMESPDRPEEFSPLTVLGWIASRIERGTETEIPAFFDEEHALWKQATEWQFRITQTVVDQINGRTQDLGRMDLAVPRAVAKMRAGAYPDIETAMRAEYGWILRGIGIRFDPEGPILTVKDARQSAMGQFALMNREFVEEVNSDMTTDTVIGPPIRLGPPPGTH